MASYQNVGNINIIMKFHIGHKAFISLCTTLPYLYELCQAESGMVAFVKEGAGGWNLFLITVKVNYVLVNCRAK